MSDEIKARLKDDVESLSDNDKNKYCEMSKTIVVDVHMKKGKSKKTSVQVSEDDKTELVLMAINKKFKLQRPSSMERLEKTGLTKESVDYLRKSKTNDELRNYHLKDIIKAESQSDLSRLNSEEQLAIIKGIVDNRNNLAFENTEEVVMALIKKGILNDENTDTWFRAVMRHTNKLIALLGVDSNVLTPLDTHHKQTLRNKLTILAQKSETTIRRLE